MDVDIIVPVWNRPVETRSCLVDLIKYTPQARFIMVDNGSDEETETLLEEFADLLMERALFLRSGLNHGFVKAVNRGLSMATAPNIAVVRNTSMVTEGWLDPILRLAGTRTDAGIVNPRLIKGDAKKGNSAKFPVLPPEEISHGSFASLFLKKSIYDEIGGFDENLDGADYCLKDYSRRAYRAGYLTFVAEGAPVYYRDEIALGSDARREEMMQRTRSEYLDRWGEELTFCIYFPKQTPFQVAQDRFDMILRGAREGHHFLILVHGGLHSDLERAGQLRLHRNMTVETVPFLFHADAMRKRYVKLREVRPGARMVPGLDGFPFPGVTGTMTFAELERFILSVERERYRKIPDEMARSAQ